jgi:hypothetical protein
MLTKAQTEALVKHLREIASILEKSVGSTNKVEEPIALKRGRKPGAVSDDVRCQEVLTSGDRCKNRATKGTLCGKHHNE